MAEKYPKQYEILLRKAKADIAMALHALDAGDADIDDATILFHFQQAAEKLLKVLLSFNDVHFEKIHDIASLLDLCKEHGIPLPPDADGFSTLNPFAVAGRYDILDDTGIKPRTWRAQMIEFKKFVEDAVSHPGYPGKKVRKNGKTNH